MSSRISLFQMLVVLVLAIVSASTARAADPAAGADPDETAYQLQEGDMLEISVWKEEGLAREIMIAPDGNISFPLVGQIRAKGLTVAGLETELARRIATFIPDPSVTVVLKGATGSKFYVIGKVNRPGEFPLLGPISVLQALSVAGGTATFADFNGIKIIRRVNGVDQALNFRYGDIENGEKLAQNIQLRSGDVVVVP